MIVDVIVLQVVLVEDPGIEGLFLCIIYVDETCARLEPLCWRVAQQAGYVLRVASLG